MQCCQLIHQDHSNDTLPQKLQKHHNKNRNNGSDSHRLVYLIGIFGKRQCAPLPRGRRPSLGSVVLCGAFQPFQPLQTCEPTAHEWKSPPCIGGRSPSRPPPPPPPRWRPPRRRSAQRVTDTQIAVTYIVTRVALRFSRKFVSGDTKFRSMIVFSGFWKIDMPFRSGAISVLCMRRWLISFVHTIRDLPCSFFSIMKIIIY